MTFRQNNIITSREIALNCSKLKCLLHIFFVLHYIVFFNYCKFHTKSYFLSIVM